MTKPNDMSLTFYAQWLLGQSHHCDQQGHHGLALHLSRSAYHLACMASMPAYDERRKFGDPDPCQDEVDALAAQTLIVNAATTCLAQEEAAKSILEQALMECRMNNP